MHREGRSSGRAGDRRTIGHGRAALLSGWCALVMILVLASGTGPAHAHASLVASTPVDGARLEQAPTFVSLRFSESVAVPDNGLEVVGSDGTRVDSGAPVVNGSDVQIALKQGLGDGGYIVTWRMISADAHPIRGAISFVVGDGPAPSVSDAGEDGDSQWKVIGAGLRFVTYLAAGLLVGGALFLVVVHDGEDEARRFSRLLCVAALVTIVGALLQLPVHAALATGRGVGSLFGDSGSDLLNGGTGWSIGLIAIGALLGLEALLLSSGDRRILAFAGLPVLFLIPLGFAIAGHATTGSGSDWAIVSNLIHTIAGAIWFGGLVLLVLTWRNRRDSDDPVSATRIVRRFSTVATVALLVVSGAGVALGWREVRTWNGLFETAYGRVLIVKLLVVAVVAALGGFNHFRLVPRLGGSGADHDAAWRRLGTTIRYEATALVFVFALTGVLVDLTPPQRRIDEPTGVTEKRLVFGDFTLDLLVEGGAGDAQVHGTVLTAEGAPQAIEADQVTVAFELASQGLGPIERPVTAISTGHFSVDGSVMTVPGDWRITITARTSRFDEVEATTKVTVPA